MSTVTRAVAGEHMLGEAVLATPRPIHVQDDLSFGDLGDRDVEAGDPLGRAGRVAHGEADSGDAWP